MVCEIWAQKSQLRRGTESVQCTTLISMVFADAVSPPDLPGFAFVVGPGPNPVVLVFHLPPLNFCWARQFPWEIVLKKSQRPTCCAWSTSVGAPTGQIIN